MADPQGNPIDVKKVIEQSASKTTLQELAKKGIYRVKVLDETAITRMIGEAVQRIVGTKTNLISDTDRAKLVEASRKELDKLVKEFQGAKDRTELMEKDKAALAEQVENLQRQLQLQRKYTEELGKQRYEEGRASSKQQLDDLRAQLSGARKEGADDAREAQHELLDEVRRQAAQHEGELRRQIEAEKDAEYNRRLLEETQREARKREELQEKLTEQNARNLEMSQKLATTMEEMKKSDEELFKKITELFTRSLDSLNKKLTDLRLRAIAGAGASLPGDAEFRPSQATIEGLLSHELDSNLKKMEVEGKTGGKISSALDRLKALRGKPEEKKP